MSTWPFGRGWHIDARASATMLEDVVYGNNITLADNWTKNISPDRITANPFVGAIGRLSADVEPDLSVLDHTFAMYVRINTLDTLIPGVHIENMDLYLRNGTLRLLNDSGIFNSGASLAAGVNYRIIVTYKSPVGLVDGQVRFWLDGVLLASIPTGTSSLAQLKGFRRNGADPTGSIVLFDNGGGWKLYGDIHRMLWWPRVLPDAEIAQADEALYDPPVLTYGPDVPPPSVPDQPGAFTDPVEGQLYQGAETPAWGAANYASTYELEYTDDGGDTWTPIADGIGATSFNWNTAAIDWVPNAKLRVRGVNMLGPGAWRESPTFNIWQGVPGDLGLVEMTAVTGWSIRLEAEDVAGLSRLDARIYEADGATPRSDVVQGIGPLCWITGLPQDRHLTRVVRGVFLDGTTGDWSDPVDFRTLNQQASHHGTTFYAADSMGRARGQYGTIQGLGSHTLNAAGFAEFGIHLSDRYGIVAPDIYGVRLNMADPQAAIPAIQDNLDGLWRQVVRFTDSSNRFTPGSVRGRCGLMVGFVVPAEYFAEGVELVLQRGDLQITLANGSGTVTHIITGPGTQSGSLVTRNIPGSYEADQFALLYLGFENPDYTVGGGAPPTCVYTFEGETGITLFGGINTYEEISQTYNMTDLAFCVDLDGNEFSFSRLNGFGSFQLGHNNPGIIDLGGGSSTDPFQGFATPFTIWSHSQGKIISEAEYDAILAAYREGGDPLALIETTDPFAVYPLNDYAAGPNQPVLTVGL